MDSVVLILTRSNYTIVDPKKFKDYFIPMNPNDTEQRIRFLQQYRGSRSYKQNPPVAWRESGKVYPNLTIYERIRRGTYSCDLHVAVSLAKLLNGHSFKDIYNEDLPKIVELLTLRLLDMGVVVTKENVLNAIVQTIHYSINFLFSSENEARIFLNMLGKCSLSDWFENNHKTFANNGHAVRFHTDVFEIVFYLKYYDVLSSSNKSVDRKKTPQEKAIADKAQKDARIPPLVRMEIRLNGIRSVKTHLKAALGIEKDRWVFSEVFDFMKSRKALLHFWNKIPINLRISSF